MHASITEQYESFLICTLVIKFVMTRRDIGDYVKACKQKHVEQPIRVINNLSDGSIHTAKNEKEFIILHINVTQEILLSKTIFLSC